jgi:hypothetical protein
MGPVAFLGYLLSLLNGPLEYGGLVGHTVNTKKKKKNNNNNNINNNALLCSKTYITIINSQT